MLELFNYLLFSNIPFMLGMVAMCFIMCWVAVKLTNKFPEAGSKIPEIHMRLLVILLIFLIFASVISAIFGDAEISWGGRSPPSSILAFPFSTTALLYNLIFLYYLIKEKAKKRRG